MATVTVTENTNIETLVEILGCDKFAVSRDGNILAISDVTQEDLDSGWATYNADLEAYEFSPTRTLRKDKSSQAAADFISETYPSFRRELFIALAEEARNSGLTNRLAYINQMFTWVKTIVAAVMAAEDMIDAVMTIEEINSINLNTEVFASTDPEITVRGAMAIED